MAEYQFTTAERLLSLCEKHKKSIGEIVVLNSIEEQNLTEAELFHEMSKRFTVMVASIEKGMKITQRTPSGLSGGDAKKLDKYSTTNLLLGKTLFNAVKYSFAIMETNARFGRIVAFPTAGSAGTVPGTLFAAHETLKTTEKEVLLAIFAAAAVGIITGQNAMLAGAMGGCQAEVGTAAAMAACGLTQLRGGTPGQCLNAASICLKGMLGLVCDPIAGLVEAPCVKRNATGISNAFMASEISMAGIETNVPYDEVVVAMANVAKLMAVELRETARGGLAITKTGQRVACKING